MIGPRNVEWTPIANSAASSSGIALCASSGGGAVRQAAPAPVAHSTSCQAISSPAAPTSMIPISHPFTIRMIRALSRMSASCPASAERTKKGTMKTPEATALNIASSASEL